MNRLTILIFINDSIFYSFALSFNDTLISFDVRTRKIENIKSVPFDNNSKYDNTEWNLGSINGISELPLVKPTVVFPGAGFTNLIPAQKLFPISNYPIRTAVKIFVYIKDTLIQACSGIMVSKDLVLTASHCLYEYVDSLNTIVFRDSILAVPDYDNGRENPLTGSSISATYYLSKSNYESYDPDVALIRLREPIGLKTGWIGISFIADNDSLKNKVFHKFSYPGEVDPHDSTRIFNGDTLYYNYGTLDFISKDMIGYNLYGVRGQSGSSLFYTDNYSYYSIGVLNYSTQSLHYRFDRELYFAFKNIIEGSINSADQRDNYSATFNLANAYPNPFNPTTSIEYSIGYYSQVILDVFDVLGRKVQNLVNNYQPQGEYRIKFNGFGLPSGVYFVRLQAGKDTKLNKIVLTK